MLAEDGPVNLLPFFTSVFDALQAGTVRYLWTEFVWTTSDTDALAIVILNVGVPSGNEACAVLGLSLLNVALSDGTELQDFVHVGSIPSRVTAFCTKSCGFLAARCCAGYRADPSRPTASIPQHRR